MSRSTDNVTAALAAGSQVYHEVWSNGVYTGRRFTSLIQAQRYASKRPNSEVRASR